MSTTNHKVLNIPKNCKNCLYSNICHAPYYGSSMCKYKDKIYREHINNFMKK